MSKFLTPPVWYDKNGNVNEMLNGNIIGGVDGGIPIGEAASVSGDKGIAIGQEASTISPNGIAIGADAKVNSPNGIAIRGTVSLSSNNGVAIGGTVNMESPNGIAIGGTVSGANGIAIGQGANVSTQNTIQLGENNTAYTLKVGNGTGTINGVSLSVNAQNTIQLGRSDSNYTLKVGNGAELSGNMSILEIGSIKFKKMGVSNNKVTLLSQGVYLCCTTKNGESGVVICFIGNLDGRAAVLESSTGLCTYVARDISTDVEVHQIQASSGVAIDRCFKIISI